MSGVLKAGGEFAVRVVGRRTLPSLALRLPGPGDPVDLVDGALELDPLRGSEVWRAVTPCTMLAGPRDTATAGRLLAELDAGLLDGLRLRVATARPVADRRTPYGARDRVYGRQDRRYGGQDRGHGRQDGTHDTQDRTYGALSGLGTLLCWPRHARLELTAGTAEAASRALRRPHGTGSLEAAEAFGWVVSLAEAFPGDPLALAPLLVTLRRFPAGHEVLLPGRWPVAVLSGEAVGVSGAGSVLVKAGLGAADADPAGFLSGLEHPPAGYADEADEPDDVAIAGALSAVRRIVSRMTGPRHAARPKWPTAPPGPSSGRVRRALPLPDSPARVGAVGGD